MDKAGRAGGDEEILAAVIQAQRTYATVVNQLGLRWKASTT